MNIKFIKQSLVFLVKLAVAGGLFYWLFSTGQLDFQSILDESLNPYHIVGLAAILGSTFAASLRWGALLDMQGLAFKKVVVLRWTLIGEFFGLALPGSAGTELSRAYYLLRNVKNAKTAALSSIIVDRLFAMTSLMLIGFLAFLALLITSEPVGQTIFVLGSIMGGILLASILGFFMIGFRPFRTFVQMPLPYKYKNIVDNIIVSYVDRKKMLLKSLALSFWSYVLIFVAFFIAAEILSTNVSWKELAIAMPLVMISIVLPITPAGIGVGETAAAFIFTLLGVPNGGAIMLITRVWLVTIQLLGGVVYLFHRHDNEGK